MVTVVFECIVTMHYSCLQFSRGDLDKVGRRAKTICGPGFCLELLFGPLEPQVPSPQIRNLEDSFELL